MRHDRILILGGTRDARLLAEALVADGHLPITSLAGVTEQPVRPPGELRVGGFGGVDGLKSYLASGHFALVVDATHPFAARMSWQAFEACRDSGVPLLRCERAAWVAGEGDDWTIVSSAAEAAASLPAGARVLLTTGRKDLALFFGRPDISGIARMIEEPPVNPPPNWTILRERPPFTVPGEATLMLQNAISHLVTKNAGGPATEAKLQAARERGIPVLVIARPAKPEVPSFESTSSLMAALKRLLCP